MDSIIIPYGTVQNSMDSIWINPGSVKTSVNLCFTMTINKSQGQSVANVGLNLQHSVFTHEQLYVVISRVTASQNIKAIWEENKPNSVTKNIVYPEVTID